MAISSAQTYRLGYYFRDRDAYRIEQNPLTREETIEEVKAKYNPDDPDTDVFVAVLPIPDDTDLYARDIPATEEAQHFYDEESENDSVSSASSSGPSAPNPTPPLPNTPAAQAAVFFPVKEGETDEQRKERTDAQTLFTTYPLTAQDLWRRFHEPALVESTMFDIWETARRPTQGPEAAKDMVRANIGRMKNGKAWELQAMEKLFEDDTD